MDLIRQNRLMAITVGLLVLLNLTALGTLWWTRLAPPPLPGPAPQQMPGPEGRNVDVVGFLARELKFDRDQTRQFRQLRARFFDEEFRLRQEIHDLKQALTKAVFDANTDPDQMNALAVQIGEKHQEMELIQFEHLRAIKSLCTPQQKERFMALMDDVLRLTQPRGQGPRRGAGRGFGPGAGRRRRGMTNGPPNNAHPPPPL